MASSMKKKGLGTHQATDEPTQLTSEEASSEAESIVRYFINHDPHPMALYRKVYAKRKRGHGPAIRKAIRAKVKVDIDAERCEQRLRMYKEMGSPKGDYEEFRKLARLITAESASFGPYRLRSKAAVSTLHHLHYPSKIRAENPTLPRSPSRLRGPMENRPWSTKSPVYAAMPGSGQEFGAPSWPSSAFRS